MDLLSTLNDDHIRVAALQDSIREHLQKFVESDTLIEGTKHISMPQNYATIKARTTSNVSVVFQTKFSEVSFF